VGQQEAKGKAAAAAAARLLAAKEEEERRRLELARQQQQSRRRPLLLLPLKQLNKTCCYGGCSRWVVVMKSWQWWEGQQQGRQQGWIRMRMRMRMRTRTIIVVTRSWWWLGGGEGGGRHQEGRTKIRTIVVMRSWRWWGQGHGRLYDSHRIIYYSSQYPTHNADSDIITNGHHEWSLHYYPCTKSSVPTWHLHTIIWNNQQHHQTVHICLA